MILHAISNFLFANFCSIGLGVAKMTKRLDIKQEVLNPEERFGQLNTSPKKKKLENVKIKQEFDCKKSLKVVLERCDYLKEFHQAFAATKTGCPSGASSLGTITTSLSQFNGKMVKAEKEDVKPMMIGDVFDIKPVKGLIVIQPEMNHTPAPVQTNSSNKKSGSTSMNDMTLNLDTMAEIRLGKTVNRRTVLPLQILYVKLDIYLTGSMLALVGWNSEADSTLMFHCIFCPWAVTSAKKIASHLKNEHSLVSFATSKKTHTTTAILYMQCMRCDYVGIDYVAVWIHYALHHGIDGVMTLSSCDQVNATATLKKLTPEHQATVFPFFGCTECDVIFNDSRHIAKHITECHYIGDISSSYNGCFVKIKKVTRPKTSANESYKKLLEDDAFADTRSEMFLCLMCSYFSFCRFLAFSHHLRVHTGKAMIYVCCAKNCTHRSSTPDDMTGHMKEVHKLSGIGNQRMRCNVTLIRQVKGQGLCECVH